MVSPRTTQRPQPLPTHPMLRAPVAVVTAALQVHIGAAAHRVHRLRLAGHALQGHNGHPAAADQHLEAGGVRGPAARVGSACDVRPSRLPRRRAAADPAVPQPSCASTPAGSTCQGSSQAQPSPRTLCGFVTPRLGEGICASQRRCPESRWTRALGAAITEEHVDTRPGSCDHRGVPGWRELDSVGGKCSWREGKG